MSKGKQIWLAGALLLAASSFAALPSNAGTTPSAGIQSEFKLMPEPYEPGSSAVMNDWHFSPGEPTLVGANFWAHHQHTVRNRTNHHHRYHS